jgi:glutathione S-transferase
VSSLTAKVPVLRDGDFVVTGSLAILVYLDRRVPEPPLFGRTAEETASIWRFALDFDNHALPHFTGLIRPIFFGQVAAERDQVDAAAEAVERELATLEMRLDRQRWLAGDMLSAADIAVYPFLEALLRAAGKPAATSVNLRLLPFEQHFPALAAWRQRIVALPGYEGAYPPHWRAAA